MTTAPERMRRRPPLAVSSSPVSIIRSTTTSDGKPTNRPAACSRTVPARVSTAQKASSRRHGSRAVVFVVGVVRVSGVGIVRLRPSASG